MSSGNQKLRLTDSEGLWDPMRTEPTNPAVEGPSQITEGLQSQETPPRLQPFRPMVDSQFRGIPIQNTPGRLRSEEARSDLASYGSLDGNRQSSVPSRFDHTPRNSSPNRLYSPHRPEAIVPSQPIHHIPHTLPRPHQSHRFVLETPIEPLSRPTYRGRDRSFSSSLRRSSSPGRHVHYEVPPPFTQSGQPHPYAIPTHSTSAYPFPVAMQPARIPEPPYVAVNPFRLDPWEPVPLLTLPISSGHRRHRRPGQRRRLRNLLILIFVRIPLQIYLHILLRLPLLYFSRVSRLFEDASLSILDIRRMVVANAHQWKDGTPGSLMTMWLPEEATVSPNLHNFRHSWEGFIDSLMREWKTQNVVSALMLSAILTVLQIDGAASDPITRTTALLSLISALMSLLFGSMYIMRFGGMRKMYKAASWAEEAQKGSTSILWNVWILLAIPTIWLVWSIVLFVTCIMAFTWRTGATGDTVHAALSHNTAQGLRIGVSAVLAVALIYFLLVVKTFRKYGDAMDRRWRQKVIGWTQEGHYAQIGMHPGAWVPDPPPNPHSHAHRPHSRAGSFNTPSTPRGSRSNLATERRRGRSESRRGLSFIPPVNSDPPISFNRPADLVADLGMGTFPAAKIMDLRYQSSRTYPLPTILQNRDILLEDWTRFTGNLEDIWDGKRKEISPFPLELEPGLPVTGTRESGAAGLINLWNTKFFHPRFAEAVLCREEPRVGVPGYSVYLIPRSPNLNSSAHAMPSPDDYNLKSITVFRLVDDPNGRQWSNQVKVVAHLHDGGGHGEKMEAEVETLGPSWKTVLPLTASQVSSPSQKIPSSGSSLHLSIPLPPSPAPDAPSSPAPNTESPFPVRPHDSAEPHTLPNYT
ncbi:hypothetical protein C8F04DRAFT_1115827 [Mycena alexandri]|uniref:Uncharacterized protein n=1 Tax=Mycena alexandri TaxID=1745969 RepID=A0AAD6SMR0_9AGAR|nr:hypothetical protein C8F04DRAFT_1115827 [Mycena alexandri]